MMSSKILTALVSLFRKEERKREAGGSAAISNKHNSHKLNSQDKDENHLAWESGNSLASIRYSLDLISWSTIRKRKMKEHNTV